MFVSPRIAIIEILIIIAEIKAGINLSTAARGIIIAGIIVRISHFVFFTAERERHRAGYGNKGKRAVIECSTEAFIRGIRRRGVKHKREHGYACDY